MITLDKFNRSRTDLNDSSAMIFGSSNKIFILNKTEDLNVKVFNKITKFNESKTLMKHISCNCRCKFDG